MDFECARTFRVPSWATWRASICTLVETRGLSLGSMLPSEERAVRAGATRALLVLAKRIFGGFQAPWFLSRKRSTVLAVSRVDAGFRSPLDPMRGVIIILDGM